MGWTNLHNTVTTQGTDLIFIPKMMMTRPFNGYHMFDLDLVSRSPQSLKVFTFETLKVAQTFIFGLGRFLSCMQIHLLKINPTYINQIILTSVKVTAGKTFSMEINDIHLTTRVILMSWQLSHQIRYSVMFYCLFKY